jgi:hypothetical protein
VAVRRSPGQAGIWSAGSRHHSAALEEGSRRQTLRRGQARQGSNDVSERPRPQFPGPIAPPHPRTARPATARQPAPGAARSPDNGGSAAQIFTPQRRHLGAPTTLSRPPRRCRPDHGHLRRAVPAAGRGTARCHRTAQATVLRRGPGPASSPGSLAHRCSRSCDQDPQDKALTVGRRGGVIALHQGSQLRPRAPAH